LAELEETEMHAITQTDRPLSVSGAESWDRNYEFKAVSLLSLGFGMVGLDRFIISPLFPAMQKDLGLNYQDLGLISAVLALTWGIASIVGGRLSDRLGTKRVLIPAIIIFSLLVATSGLATGLISLLLIRGLMGLAEGAYVPASIVATAQASKPTRIGMNVGIQQMAAPLFGLGFGPVIAVALLQVVPSWHWVFAAVALPGLVLAFIMAKVLRNDAAVSQRRDVQPVAEERASLLRYRGVIVNTAAMICYLTCLITLSAFMPNYLTDHLKLSFAQMGTVLAGQGLGSFIGMVIIPALSDRLGRKPVIVVALVLEIAALIMLPRAAAEPYQLFALLFVITFMNAGVVAITVGPLTRSAVPISLVSSATGLVVGVGEIIGGAVAPAVAGALAQRVGITVIPTIALVSIVLGTAIVILGVREGAKA
jgi:MFS family permease